MCYLKINISFFRNRSFITLEKYISLKYRGKKKNKIAMEAAEHTYKKQFIKVFFFYSSCESITN